MIRRFLFSAAALFCILATAAQNNEALLWKIEHPKRKGTSYLVGTIHMADERNDRWLGTLEVLLTQTNTVIGEVDLRDMAKAQASLSKIMFLDKGKLKDLYAPDDYASVKKLLEARFGLLAPFFENIKPIFTALTPASELMNRDDGGKVLDDRIQSIALAKGLPVSGLEKAEVTLKRLSAIDLKEQARYLRYSIEKEVNEPDVTAEMLDFYFNDDMPALARMSSEFAGFPALEKMLIHDRNALFAARLVKLIKKNKSVFCAVGALHLPGPTGMVQLLKNRGYLLTPMPMKELATGRISD